MCSTICLGVTIGVMLILIGCGGGGISLWAGITGLQANTLANCTVIQQRVVKESCAFACNPCDSNNAPGEPCGCAYSAYTDNIKWAYMFGNNTLTTQTQVCTDGGTAYNQGYQESCWYNKKNPTKVWFMSPAYGWVMVTLGIIFVLLGIGSIIGTIIWLKRQQKTKPYTPLIAPEDPIMN
jgi:hypothetical protein